MVLRETQIELEDGVLGQAEKDETLILLLEEEELWIVRKDPHGSDGRIPKDFAELVVAWLPVRTASCDSGSVPSDSIDVLDTPTEPLPL